MGHGVSRLAAERTTDILRIVVTKRRERCLDRRRLGTIFLMTGQTGHHHIEQLGIDKRQRIAQLLGIRLEPQLLGLLGRGERHIGLATKELGQVASRRVGADGLIGRSVHLKTIGTGDVTRLLARTRGARSTRRRLVRRDARQ